MRVAVVAAGDIAADPDVVARLLAECALVIAADGGLEHCVACGVWPAIIIGDLDSAPAHLIEAAESHGAAVRRFPRAKDETDLELAISAACDAGATEVVAVGVFGKRVDHELANVGLLASARWKSAGVRIEAHDGDRSMWVVHDHVALTLDIGATVSLLPWGGDAVGVRSAGVQWPLDAATLPAGTPRGVSNVVTEPTQTVSVEHGTLLVIAPH